VTKVTANAGFDRTLIAGKLPCRRFHAAIRIAAGPTARTGDQD
jgi:hypothetical protein